MERKEIRGQIAWLSFMAQATGDQELARLLAQVHNAILSDQVDRVYDGIRAVCDTRHGIDRGTATDEQSHAPEVLVERALG